MGVALDKKLIAYFLIKRGNVKSLRVVTSKTPVDLVSSRGQIRTVVTPKDQYIAQRAHGAYICYCVSTRGRI